MANELARRNVLCIPESHRSGNKCAVFVGDPVSTIIKRAVDALRASNSNEIAAELLQLATNLRDTSLKLLANYEKQARTMRLLINVMQVRCPHHEWYLGATNDESNPGTWGPEDTIVCHNCGHTVCDARAYAFGKRVKQGDYFIYSKGNGRRFGLNTELKRRLGDKLKVKELTDDDLLKETLRAGGKSTGKEQATDASPGSRPGNDPDPKGEGRAVEEGCGGAG